MRPPRNQSRDGAVRPAIESERVPELDAMRGLAAFGVVLFHSFPRVFFLGWTCVDLFFVLSGFLISSIILEHVRKPGFFVTFYYRRALRIWPVYYVTLAGVLLINRLSPTGYPVGALPWHLFFAQNAQYYWGAKPPLFIPMFTPSWSVAIEEQFYLLWPACLYVAGRRRLIPVALSLLAVSVVARSAGLAQDVLLARFDGLALGSILAGLWSRIGEHEGEPRARAVRRLSCSLVAVGAIAGVFATAYAIHFWGDPYERVLPVVYTIFAALWFAAVGLAVCHSGHPALAPLRLRPLSSLGLISYAMYMFHLPILAYVPAFLGRAGVRSPLVVAIVAGVAIFLLPIASWRLIERPISRWKELRRYG